jgi:hypothetical protein
MAAASVVRLLVKSQPKECDLETGAPPAGGGVCSTGETVRKIASFLVSKNADGAGGAASPPDVISLAALVLGCESEACVVTHPEVESHVAATAGAAALEAMQKQSIAQFKPGGPRLTTELLSNFNIDWVQERWARTFKTHFNCPFAMMDFESAPYLFGRVGLDLVVEGKVVQKVFCAAAGKGVPAQRKCRTFGCVLNTDVSSGPGKHWVCVFADARSPAEWTVEYFNSSGNPPPPAVTRWMENQAACMRRMPSAGAAVRTLVVSNVQHQMTDTECGVYSLYYIRARLEGVPYTAFAEKRVPDSDMLEFRKNVFSNLVT